MRGLRRPPSGCTPTVTPSGRWSSPLALSDGLPLEAETARLQLRLLTALPAPLVALEGYGSERMSRVHTRALRLAGQLGSAPSRRWCGPSRWPP